MTPESGQVVTVFQRVTPVTWPEAAASAARPPTAAAAASPAAWRDHPEHRAVERGGVAGYDEASPAQVGATSYASAWSWQQPRA